MLLLDGVDPAAHRQLTKAAAAVTFKQIGEERLTKKHFSPATLAKARWLFDTWLYPDLASRPVNVVTPAELLSIVRRAEADGSNETAHRLRSRASQVFRYAIAAGCGGSEAAADLAERRMRARLIMSSPHLTTAARLEMLRTNEADLRAALRRWREVSGIAISWPASPSAAKGQVQSLVVSLRCHQRQVPGVHLRSVGP